MNIEVVRSYDPTPSPNKPFEVGSWQRMRSGLRLNLLDPRPADISITDIALGLSRTARWNGNTVGEHTFSVAQHSVIVEKITRVLNPTWGNQECLMSLLHDAPEYVIGDLHGPFKRAIGEGYRTFEDKIMSAILVRFDLPDQIPDDIKKAIKEADNIAAYYESTLINYFDQDEASFYFGTPPPIPEIEYELQHLFAHYQDRAMTKFLDRFNQLYDGV